MAANYIGRTTADATLENIFMGKIDEGITSVGVVRLYNNGTTAATTLRAGGALIDWNYAGGNNLDGQEAITEKWLECRTAGGTFVAVGGDPDINGIPLVPPVDLASVDVEYRLNVPAGFSTSGNFGIIPIWEWDV